MGPFRPTRADRAAALPGDVLVPDARIGVDHAVSLPEPPRAFRLAPEGVGSRLHGHARTRLAELEMPALGVIRVPGRLAGPAAALIHGITQRIQRAGLRARVRTGSGP